MRLGLPGGSGVSVPALDLSFLNSETLDSRITFTRASAGTRTNSSGVIESITTNNPRFDYSPTSIGTLRGLLIEGQRTNLLLNSTIDGASLATQDVTVTAQAYTLSFYGTGTVTLSGVSTAGPAVGGGAYPTRTTLTFTPTAGTLTLTVTGTVQFANLEAGSFATSFIPTAGATATRAADNASMTGTAFSGWYNQASGTFICEARTGTGNTGGQLVVDDGTTNNQLSQNATISPNFVGMFVRTGGVVQADIFELSTLSANTIIKTASAAAANDFILYVNGAVRGAPDTAGSMPAPTQLRIGIDRAGAYRNGHIRSIRYYRSRLPNATLASLST